MAYCRVRVVSGVLTQRTGPPLCRAAPWASHVRSLRNAASIGPIVWFLWRRLNCLLKSGPKATRTHLTRCVLVIRWSSVINVIWPKFTWFKAWISF